jgi:ubiquinone/menaquinone biosynthesis C-methylase UbiE
MDASNLDFPEECFDTVVNYLGLEDIYMTQGKTGVFMAFKEAYRVLKPGGSFFFVALPSDEMDTNAQRIEVNVFDWICGAKWLTSNQYLEMAERTGFQFIRKKSYYTGKKLTPDQAREEIMYACKNVSRNYGVNTKSYKETWSKFSELINQNGMGHYSKTVLFELLKPL